MLVCIFVILLVYTTLQNHDSFWNALTCLVFKAGAMSCHDFIFADCLDCRGSMRLEQWSLLCGWYYQSACSFRTWSNAQWSTQEPPWTKLALFCQMWGPFVKRRIISRDYPLIATKLYIHLITSSVWIRSTNANLQHAFESRHLLISSSSHCKPFEMTDACDE